ncbi:hypothetical protein HD596_002715 [Nonomuraea jabiensis]|uniref:Uncharacterized protein n=1 Tax=Nonomuraea jabiensis TaxID=882448 RepID=A0A7W9G2J8_9ACTN|nr:hypothetical protein [Nonomuraea jabiensis]
MRESPTASPHRHEPRCRGGRRRGVHGCLRPPGGALRRCGLAPAALAEGRLHPPHGTLRRRSLTPAVFAGALVVGNPSLLGRRSRGRPCGNTGMRLSNVGRLSSLCRLATAFAAPRRAAPCAAFAVLHSLVVPPSARTPVLPRCAAPLCASLCRIRCAAFAALRSLRCVRCTAFAALRSLHCAPVPHSLCCIPCTPSPAVPRCLRIADHADGSGRSGGRCATVARCGDQRLRGLLALGLFALSVRLSSALAGPDAPIVVLGSVPPWGFLPSAQGSSHPAAFVSAGSALPPVASPSAGAARAQGIGVPCLVVPPGRRNAASGRAAMGGSLPFAPVCRLGVPGTPRQGLCLYGGLAIGGKACWRALPGSLLFVSKAGGGRWGAGELGGRRVGRA